MSCAANGFKFIRFWFSRFSRQVERNSTPPNSKLRGLNKHTSTYVYWIYANSSCFRIRFSAYKRFKVRCGSDARLRWMEAEEVGWREVRWGKESVGCLCSRKLVHSIFWVLILFTVTAMKTVLFIILEHARLQKFPCFHPFSPPYFLFSFFFLLPNLRKASLFTISSATQGFWDAVFLYPYLLAPNWCQQQLFGSGKGCFLLNTQPNRHYYLH